MWIPKNHQHYVQKVVFAVIEFIDDKDAFNKDAQTRVFFIDTAIFIVIKIGG